MWTFLLHPAPLRAEVMAHDVLPWTDPAAACKVRWMYPYLLDMLGEE
jgi:hypothetical protein